MNDGEGRQAAVGILVLDLADAYLAGHEFHNEDAVLLDFLAGDSPALDLEYLDEDGCYANGNYGEHERRDKQFHDSES